MKLTNRIGVLLLACFLILTGLGLIIDLRFQYSNYVLGGLAIAAALFLALDK
jgi:hypothetical protein